MTLDELKQSDKDFNNFIEKQITDRKHYRNLE